VRSGATVDEAEHMFGTMLDGALDDAAIVATLTIMADRGESAAEIAGAARALRQRMITIDAPDNAIDVCGTGGDGSHSLNVSTAVAIVVAACGVPVAKHGNRAASSKAGAADTLEALGLDLDRASVSAGTTLADLGLCFLFAQTHHPALARLAGVRRMIGRRTIFNLIGPLANPARVRRQMIGVSNTAILPVYAQAVALLGMDDAMIVAGADPLDELSVAGPSHIVRLGHDQARVTPIDAGLPLHPADAMRGGDAAHNAAALRALLLGAPGAYRDAVLFNAAGALIVAGHVTDWRDGVEDAAEAIDRGLAKSLLDCWIAYQ
jgi:anthranilate phosphoribosyltransferase